MEEKEQPVEQPVEQQPSDGAGKRKSGHKKDGK